jgi:hypothetical protein
VSITEVLALIERLESDLAALKNAIQPQAAVDDADLRERVAARRALMRKARAR